MYGKEASIIDSKAVLHYMNDKRTLPPVPRKNAPKEKDWGPPDGEKKDKDGEDFNKNGWEKWKPPRR